MTDIEYIKSREPDVNTIMLMAAQLFSAAIASRDLDRTNATVCVATAYQIAEEVKIRSEDRFMKSIQEDAKHKRVTK